MPTTQQTVTTRIRDLVAIPSVSSTDARWDSSNLGVVELLGGYAESQGFSVETLPLAGDLPKANVLARMGPPVRENLAGGLILSGHTDTVPFDEGRWTSDPLTLSERDGSLYGLGSADMKGFFAVALAAAERFDPRALTRPLYLLGTADEESSMNGARQLEMSHLAGAEAAVIGEPTSLRPVRLHKGIMMQAIDLHGRSGHSSDPSLGNNVIDALPELLQILADYRESLKRRFHCELLRVPAPTMNFGCLHGGDSPNRICGHMTLHFDLRMVPGLNFADVESELQDTIASLAAARGIEVTMRRLIEPVPAFEQASDSRIVREAEQASSSAAEGVNYATEAPLLQRLGLETVVLGPGSIDVAHQPDEHLELAQLGPAIDVLERMIARYCT